MNSPRSSSDFNASVARCGFAVDGKLGGNAREEILCVGFGTFRARCVVAKRAVGGEDGRTVRGAGGVDAEMMHLAVLGLTHLRMYGQTDGWMFLKCSTDRPTDLTTLE